MEISYFELVETANDTFNSLCKVFNYSVDNAFYALLGDHVGFEGYNITEECCLYIGYALVLIKESISVKFLIHRLEELLDESNMEFHKKNLKDDFMKFLEDIELIRGYIDPN